MPGIINTIHLWRTRFWGLPGDIRALTGRAEAICSHARGNRMLVYHGVCRNEPLRFNTLFITAKTLEKQLRWYKKYFHLLSLEDYYAGKFSNDRFNLCLSFDDGLANNHNIVLPLLEKYEIPAVFFITGTRQAGYDILWNDVLCAAYRYGPSVFMFGNEKYVKGRDLRYKSSSGRLLADVLRCSSFDDKAAMMARLNQYRKKAEADYWLQMTGKQIAAMAASKWVTIGCHSLNHDDLASMNAGELAKDLAVSKKYLEEVTGKPIRSLAFPYGTYTAETIKSATAAGFDQLLSTGHLYPGDENNPLLRERMTINPFISNTNQLYAIIRGKY